MAIKFATKLPGQVPASLPVYRLASPQAGTSQVATMSQRFGLTGKMRDFLSSDEWTSYQEGRFRVSVHRKSGALRYVNRDKFGVEPKNDFKLSDKESERVAKEFLERSKVHPTKQLQLHKVTHLRSAVSDIKGKDKVERVLDAGVIYRRVVDETPVEGPGGFAMVHVDPEKDVIGMRSVWRPTSQREARVKIMPVDQAVEAFEKLLSGVKGDVTVRRASFGYFEQSESDKQSYLEPAYVFLYVVQNGEVAHKSIEVIAAGEQTFAKLKGRKRFGPGEQTKRDPSSNGDHGGNNGKGDDT
jgi:hypothetical protein